MHDRDTAKHLSANIYCDLRRADDRIWHLTGGRSRSHQRACAAELSRAIGLDVSWRRK